MMSDVNLAFTGLKMGATIFLYMVLLMISIAIAILVVTFIFYLLIQTVRATYKVIKRIRANSKP